MQFKVSKLLTDNKYKATINFEFNDLENAKMDDFGEPLIEVGGTITGPPTYTLAPNQRNFRRGFPFTYSIDADGDVDAEDKVNAWVDEMDDRAQTLITTVRNQINQFTSETEKTI